MFRIIHQVTTGSSFMKWSTICLKIPLRSSWDIFLEILTPKGSTTPRSTGALQDFWIRYAEFTDMIWKQGQLISGFQDSFYSLLWCLRMCVSLKHGIGICFASIHATNIELYKIHFWMCGHKANATGCRKITPCYMCLRMFAWICGILCVAYLLHPKTNV